MILRMKPIMFYGMILVVGMVLGYIIQSELHEPVIVSPYTEEDRELLQWAAASDQRIETIMEAYMVDEKILAINDSIKIHNDETLLKNDSILAADYRSKRDSLRAILNPR